MGFQVSRSFALTSGQLAVNLILGIWLVSEYLHNPFMQQYLANLWTANATLFSVAIALGIAVILGSYLATSRGIITLEAPLSRTNGVTAPTTTLKALDVCPVCNGALRELSQTRFQCKSCHRYFKK